MRLLGSALLAAALPAAEPRWFTEAEGGAAWVARADVRIPADTGTRWSVADLADEPFAVGRVRLAVDLGRHRVQAVAAPLRIDGEGRLDQDVDFAGARFAAGSAVDARFRFDSYRLSWRYAFVQRDDLRIGAGLTVLVRDAEVRLSDGVRTARDTDVGVVPLARLEASGRLWRGWWLDAEVDGWAVEQGRAIDAAAFLRHRWERIEAAVGWRMIDGGADTDAVWTFATVHAAAAKVGVRF